MARKTIYITLTGIRLSFWALICLNLHACSAIAIEEQLLKSIRSFEDVYEKGVSSSGNHLKVSPFRYREGDPVIDNEWAYTQSGQQKAVLKTARLVPQSDADEGEPFHRTTMLLDQKRSGMKSIYLQPGVPLQEYTTSQNVRHAVLDLYAPDSNTLSLQFDLFPYAMGRGIANKIRVWDVVTESVEWNNEKCVSIKGQGEWLHKEELGTWKIHVLPEAAYMVRHAQYLLDGAVKFEVETFGLNSKNDCFYPEKSEIKIVNSP